jgi:hypothetical protein
MSQSLTLSSAPFTDAEKADVRRFCGYPAYGAGASGFQGWRYFQAYGLLEYRLNNLGPAEYQVVRQYLATLYPLETAVPGAGANLDTDKASVWTRNRDEITDRTALYDGWCARLASFLGLRTGPNFGGGSSRSVSMQI